MTNIIVYWYITKIAKKRTKIETITGNLNFAFLTSSMLTIANDVKYKSII